MTRLTALAPMLRTRDLKSSLDFYTSVLGFACVAFNEDAGWAALRRDGVEIMLAAPNAHEPFAAASFTGSLYIRCEGVDELWARLKDAAKVCYPLQDFDYGMREFAVYDMNGYLLQFGEERRRR